MVIFIGFVFAINPFIGLIFVLIGLYEDRKNNVQYSVMLALSFAALAYWFIPSHEMDLTRYFQQMTIYSDLSWHNFVEFVLSKNILIIQELLFYAISKTNNLQLLPAIVIFIVYFIMFYQITDYANQNNIHSKNMMIVIFFTVSVLPFASLVSNIRNILAFSIFIFAAYREFQQGKKNLITYVLYSVPIFIHISTVALLIIRIITPIYASRKGNRIIINIATVSSAFLIAKFGSYLTFSNRILSAFFLKANSYVNNKAGTEYAVYLQNNLFMRIEKVYFMIIIIFLLELLIVGSKHRKINRKITQSNINDNDKMISFYILLCLMVLGTAPLIITVYLRFTYPAIMLSFLVLMNYRKTIKVKLYRKIITLFMIIGGLGGFLHQVVFMNKLTDIAYMIISFMTRSIFNMFRF